MVHRKHAIHITKQLVCVRTSGHTPAMIAGWDNEPPWQDVGEWRQGGEPAGSNCRSIFVVAVQQRVSVASSHFVTRQEELHREWFRVDFR